MGKPTRCGRRALRTHSVAQGRQVRHVGDAQAIARRNLLCRRKAGRQAYRRAGQGTLHPRPSAPPLESWRRSRCAKRRDPAPDTGLTEVTRLSGAGKNDEALKLVDTRIGRGERTAPILAMRGQLLSRLGQTKDADAAFDQALATDRRDPAALLGKAQMLVDAERLEDSLIFCRRLARASASRFARSLSQARAGPVRPGRPHRRDIRRDYRCRQGAGGFRCPVYPRDPLPRSGQGRRGARRSPRHAQGQAR